MRGKPGDVRRRPPQVAPVPPAARLAPVVRRALAELRRGLAPPAASPAARGRPAPRWRCSTTTPSTGERPAFVRARLFRYELTTRRGAARDRRVVATAADRARSRRRWASLAAEHERRRGGAMIRGPDRAPVGRDTRGTAMPDPVADYETAASGFAERAGAVRRATSAGRRPARGGRRRTSSTTSWAAPPYYTEAWGGQVPDVPDDADRATRYTRRYRALADTCRQPGVLEQMVAVTARRRRDPGRDDVRHPTRPTR